MLGEGETGCHTPAATLTVWALGATLPRPQWEDSDDGRGFVSTDQIGFRDPSKVTPEELGNTDLSYSRQKWEPGDRGERQVKT